MENRDLIKAVFNDDVIKYNKWFFKADWEKAEIIKLETESKVLNIKYIIWNNGIWKDGVWENGIWKNGTWKYGYWKEGYWYNGTWKHGYWYNGTWYNGDWENGIWNNGIWEDGTWKEGSWKNGNWKKGKIYDSKKNEYIESKLPPNKCKWSSSYDK